MLYKKKTDLLSCYKKYLNELITEKKLAKEQYYTPQLIKHKQNMKKQWAVMNKLLGRNVK